VKLARPWNPGEKERSGVDEAEDCLLERWMKLGDAVFAPGAPTEAALKKRSVIAPEEWPNALVTLRTSTPDFSVMSERRSTHIGPKFLRCRHYEFKHVADSGRPVESNEHVFKARAIRSASASRFAA
jgi:hypothetical protein